MFGVLKGAGCALKTNERQAWLGHICGVCLALRHHSGHVSRVTTNYDAALLSVLCEAQNPTSPERYTSHCPLRHKFKTEITAPDSAAVQYAASVTLLMAATKIQDHVEDEEGFWQHLPGLSTRLAQRWSSQGQQLAQSLGFDTQTLAVQTRRQTTIEAQPRRDFFDYAQPTELAVAAAFQHTAVIAHTPQHADVLYEMGRMFGRIMVLLDSYEDYVNDLATQKFNALAACFKENEIQQRAGQIFEEAYTQLKQHFHRLDLARPTLARKLLLQQLKQRSYRVLELGHLTVCSCRLPATDTALAADTGTDTMLPSDDTSKSNTNFFSRIKRKRRGEDARSCCDCIFCCNCCDDTDDCCEDGGCSCCPCCGDDQGCCCQGDGCDCGNCDCNCGDGGCCDCCSCCDCNA